MISWMFWGDLQVKEQFGILWSPPRPLKLLLQVLCKNNVSWWKNTHYLALAKHTPSTPITHTQPFHSVLPRVLDVSETAMSTYPQKECVNDKCLSCGTDPVLVKSAVTCLCFLVSDCMYGTYGMECRKTCNCKAGGLCDRETGACLSFKFLAKMAMLKSHSSEGELTVYYKKRMLKDVKYM